MIISFRGKAGVNLQIVSIYTPHAFIGQCSVYQQQLQYNTEHNNKIEPIKKYDKDMRKLLSGWIAGGDQVILMIDANENLSKSKSGSFPHQMEKIGLTELILSQHTSLTPPLTRNPGTHTIEGIFGTLGLDVIKGGYPLFFGITDHRLSWIDIQWDSALGLFKKNTTPCSTTTPMQRYPVYDKICGAPRIIS